MRILQQVIFQFQSLGLCGNTRARSLAPTYARTRTAGPARIDRWYIDCVCVCVGGGGQTTMVGAREVRDLGVVIESAQERMYLGLGHASECIGGNHGDDDSVSWLPSPLPSIQPTNQVVDLVYV